MSVTNLRIAAIGQSTYRLAWDSGNSLSYVYLNGNQISVTESKEIIIAANVGEFPVVEVFDEEVDLPEHIVAPRRKLTWSPVEDAKSYRVEKYNGSTWDVVQQTNGTKYNTDVLEDDTQHSYRIIAIAGNGAESTSTTHTFVHVRYPDPPDVEFAYSDATQEVTITAR